MCGRTFESNGYVHFIHCGDGVMVKYFRFLSENEFEILQCSKH